MRNIYTKRKVFITLNSQTLQPLAGSENLTIKSQQGLPCLRCHLQSFLESQRRQVIPFEGATLKVETYRTIFES